MIINELFDNNTPVQEYSPWSIQHKFHIAGKMAAAYVLNVGSDEYIFHFDERQTMPSAGSSQQTNTVYNFSYGKADAHYDEDFINYDLTDDGTPFKIVPAIIEVLGSFITKYSPTTITFIGAQPRQDQFYRKAASFLAKRLPSDYAVAISKGGTSFFITRLARDQWPANYIEFGAAR